MNEKIMIYVPLDSYEAGAAAMARLDVLKNFTIKSNYSVSREEIASILGFDLPAKKQGTPDCEQGA